jgi:CysZ protein
VTRRHRTSGGAREPGYLGRVSQASAPKRVALGFFAGVRAVLGGVGFVVTRPAVWPLAAVPVLVALVFFGGLGALAVTGGTELAHRVVPDPASGVAQAAGFWALRLLTWVVGLVLAFVVAMSLAQPLSGPALEGIARRQELALGGRSWPDQPFFGGVLRSLRVSLTALALGLPILAVLALVTLAFPPAGVVTIPLKFLVTGLLAAYDLLDYPFSVRGEGVRARLAFMREQIWAVLGFGVTTAVLLLVPFMGLFLLPFGVAGATRLVVEQDGNSLAAPRG